jgi:hypothetical protein
MATLDLIGIVVFIITLLLVMLIIYVATRLITKEEVASVPYMSRVLLMALVIVILIPLLTSFFGSFIGLGGPGGLLAVIISFLAVVVIMRYVVISEASLRDEWLEAFAVTILCVVFTAFFNIGLGYMGIEPLFHLFS